MSISAGVSSPRAAAERYKPAIIRPPLLAKAPRGLSKILNLCPAIPRSFRSTAFGSHLPEKDRRRGQLQHRTRPAILPGRLINNKKLFKTGFSGDPERRDLQGPL